MTAQITTQRKPLFSLGSVAMTRAVSNAIAERDRPISLLPYLFRHQSGDWGDVVDADARMNDTAVGRPERIVSAYENTPIGKIYIITEADRSITTILFPEDY